MNDTFLDQCASMQARARQILERPGEPQPVRLAAQAFIDAAVLVAVPNPTPELVDRAVTAAREMGVQIEVSKLGSDGS